MSDIRENNKIDMEIKFEPFMPKIMDKLPKCGNEMMVIDIDKVAMGDKEK